MGTDIHFFAQLRDADGKWRTQGPESKYNDEETDWPNGEGHFYNDRNYDVFAMLANVRNGRGFAGIKTGGGFDVIDEPRGIPDDIDDPRLRKYLAGLHTQSWLGLDDLLWWDWTQVADHQGVVNFQEWASFAIRGKPDGWSGSVSGQSVRHFNSQAFDKAWDATRKELGLRPETKPYALMKGETAAAEHFHRHLGVGFGQSAYTLVKWREPYHDSAGSFWQSTMPRLLALRLQRQPLYGVEGDTTDVRVVFGFDS